MYVSFDDLSPQQEGRFQDRYAAIEAWFTGGQAIGEAVKIFDVLRQERNLPAVKDPYHFIHYQVDKLERYYTLLNVHEHPRGKKVPDEEIKCAADILAAGYEQRLYAMVGGVVYEYDEARHFTSIKQASMVSAPFQAIMRQYDVTPRHMLKRIHEVAPELAFSALPMKIELSPENMLYRMGYADWMYRQHTTRDPLFLYKILWGDETRIYIGRDIQGKLKVYHYPGRYDGQPPISNPLLNKENTIRLDVSLFVDAMRGLSNVEVLTGTTNLESEGRFNAPMQVLQVDRARHGQECYKTKRSKGSKVAKAATQEEYADMLTTFLPRLQEQAILTWGFRHLVSVDNASIHNVGRIPAPQPRPRPSYPNYSLGYASQFLPHPPHSPDLHQVIEHRFAELKQHLVNRVYQIGFGNVNSAALRMFVLEYCSTITPQLIRADIENLLQCYQVVRTPVGSSVLINGRSVDGVGGGWPPKHFR